MISNQIKSNLFPKCNTVPKTVREMTQLPRERQKDGDTQKITKIHSKYKPKLNTKKTLGPTGLYELVLVAVHMENFQCTV